MSFKSKIISAVTAGAAIVAFSTFAVAQDTKPDNQPQAPKQERREMRGGKFGRGEGMRRGMRGKRHGLMRQLRGLNLTEEQRTQIRTLMQANRGNSDVNREEMRTIMKAKRDGTITPDQQQKLDTFKTQMKENAKRTHEQVLAILTPEQRAQLEARKEERKRRMEERRQLRDQKKPNPDEKKDND